jgi:peptidoglycan/LPS O-acetylase OafA/YrhL
MRTRLAFIDSLRGMAVVAVLIQHLLEQIIFTQTTGPYYWGFQGASGYYFNFGRFGVVLFFFVSGFVIPNSFPSSAAPIRDFVTSRFFRLYPAYWLSILLAIAILPLTDAKTFSLSQIAANSTMLQMFVGVPNIRTAYWTLAIELIFYASCVCLFAAGFLKRRMTAVAIVLAVSIGCTVASMFIGNRMVLRLMEVALNLTAMFLGKVLRDAVIERRLSWGHVVLCSIAYVPFALSVSFRLYGSGPYDEKTFFFGYSMASSYVGAWLVFVTFCAIGSSSDWPFSAFIGRISYSVYLMHAYVLSVIVYLFGAGATPLQWLLFAGTVTGLSILASWFTFEFVEKPALAFGHRFRSGSRPAAEVGPPLQNRVVE